MPIDRAGVKVGDTRHISAGRRRDIALDAALRPSTLKPRSAANAAHLGGFAAGFLIGKIYVDREPMNARERQTASILGWVAGAVLLASFVFMILHFSDPLPGQGG